jgi:hypothetical protein
MTPVTHDLMFYDVVFTALPYMYLRFSVVEE